jgi:cell division protein FtsI (penicillin-binding protein 3)
VNSRRRRLTALSLVTLSLFSFLLVQFYKVQVIEGERWAKAAERQHRLAVIEPFRRGLFYSNVAMKAGHPEELRPFVVDMPKFHLYADPEAIPSSYRSAVAQKLGEILRLQSGTRDKLGRQLEKKSRSRRLVMWISPAQQEEILQWWNPFARRHHIPKNGLFFVQDFQRSYPFGKLLGQVLHTVRDDRDPATGESIPTGGLELTMNGFLKGKSGRRIIVRSPRHPLDTGDVVIQPEHGADVFLTINHYLQAVAEEEIEKAVKKSRAKGGWAILMEPNTGEIWALAEYPWFDPSVYRNYFSDPKMEERTKVRAITDPYEPGSAIKPITLAICLKANLELQKRGKPPLFSTRERVPVDVGHFPGRRKPLKDLHPYRALNMYMGLQKSSNVYMAKMIQRVVDTLGDAWYRAALHDLFGFGEKTGIELPAESIGLLPTPGKKHPSGAVEWSKATPYSLAMGHNILVSALQMARSYSILANGGYEVQPRLVRKVVKRHDDGHEEVLASHTAPELSRKRLLEPEIVREVVTAMRFVTKRGGTAVRADIPGYTEAGKTSTTEKIVGGVYSKKNHISTFVGFAPATHPRFVLLVAIDEPEYMYIPGEGKNHHGGMCAAPVFREIGKRTLEYLGEPLDDPDGTAWSKEIHDLKATFDAWNH